MVKIIKLSKKISIGGNNKILLIPEIGINHFGSLQRAKKIVLSAKRAGAVAIKAQVHIPDLEMSNEAKKIKPGNSNLSIYQVIKENCLTLSEEEKLKKFIEENDMLYIASCFCLEAADFLHNIGTKVFKIGSGECNHFPLLDKISKYNRPMIVSTGMHSIKEINLMISFLQNRNVNFAINHCVNIYPTHVKHSNLNKLKYLIEKFSKTIPIGLSDHSSGLAVCYAAISLGISMIEKHYVINKRLNGPDVSASMDFFELKKILVNANDLKFSLMLKKNKISKDEFVTRRFALHSAVAKTNIKKNQVLTIDNINFKRPGTGYLLANNYKKIFKKKTKSQIKKNFQIQKKNLW